jgi:hypothetical protein
MTVLVDRTEVGFQAQVDNFLTKATTYPALGLDATTLADLRKDWTLNSWLIKSYNSVDTYNNGIVAFKFILRKGGNLGALPALPVLPAAPAITSGGMEKRFRNLIQDAMRSPAMTEAIAKDLGILAPESSTDAIVAKPSFKLTYSSGGYPLIVWKKGKFEGVEIQKSKDGINFTRLDRDYKPDFIDKTDLPAPTTAEVWYYRLIYLTNETEHIGQWSDVQSISVAG